MQERHAVGVADDAGELTVVVLLLPFRQRDLLLFLGLPRYTAGGRLTAV